MSIRFITENDFIEALVAEELVDKELFAFLDAEAE
jgi:hypothetical protein